MMPVVFAGHGSPMNIIEDNNYTKGWQEIAKAVPKPKMILMISAHWVTDDNRVLGNENPDTIYDFYGFPDELYKMEYEAPGAVELAQKIVDLIGKSVALDKNVGFDHGAWSILKVMYPEADIPVTQLSVNKSIDAHEAFEIGKKLRSLRNEGVLIIGSGNVVHNLMLCDFSMNDGYKWANEFDDYILKNIKEKNFENVINYEKAGESAKKASFTIEHFYPLLYVLGAVNEDDDVRIYNNSSILGALSMTSYLFG